MNSLFGHDGGVPGGTAPRAQRARRAVVFSADVAISEAGIDATTL